MGEKKEEEEGERRGKKKKKMKRFWVFLLPLHEYSQNNRNRSRMNE